MKTLKEGDPAPDFPGRKDFLGKKKIVLYFYPKDDTPGCTKEACGFRDVSKEIEKAGAAVLGVSLDLLPAHEKFREKYSLPFPLLSDPDAKVSKAFGVYKEKTNYGRTYWGIERTTFVISRDGKIEKIFPKVKVDGHVEEVLKELRRGGSL